MRFLWKLLGICRFHLKGCIEQILLRRVSKNYNIIPWTSNLKMHMFQEKLDITCFGQFLESTIWKFTPFSRPLYKLTDRYILILEISLDSEGNSPEGASLIFSIHVKRKDIIGIEVKKSHFEIQKLTNLNFISFWHIFLDFWKMHPLSFIQRLHKNVLSREYVNWLT